MLITFDNQGNKTQGSALAPFLLTQGAEAEGGEEAMDEE
jgi:hypothetical protein